MKTCKRFLLIAAVALFAGLPMIGQQHARPVRHGDDVNVFTGTSNSRWMQFPGATVPMGMVKLSPDNQANVWDGGYEYTIGSISGFSFLHSFGLSSMSVMPLVGPIESEPGQNRLFPGPADGPFGTMWTAGYRSRIRKDTETGRPGYYAADLVDAHTHVEVSATERTGWMRLHLPDSDQAHLIFDFAPPVEEKTRLVRYGVTRVRATEIEGFLTQSDQYAGEFTVYFVCQFSQPSVAMNAWQTSTLPVEETNYGADFRRQRTLKAGIGHTESTEPGGIWLDFHTSAASPLTFKTGISFVSINNARANLAAESAAFGFDFDRVAAAAAVLWETILRRIDVEGGTRDDRTKLYTNLYRAYSAKPMVDDVNGEYRDACGDIRTLAAPADHMYSSDGLWGTQWTSGPLWSLLPPALMRSFNNSLLEQAATNGWLPEAPVNLRYSPVMAGQHQVALVAGAWQKGLGEGDGRATYAAIRKVLTQPGEPYTCGGRFPGGFAGDRHLAAYEKLGFVPEEVGPASSTFEYAFDDSCAAVLAETLGTPADVALFRKRSESWRNSISPATGYAQRRHQDGTWAEPSDIHRFGTTGGWNGPGFVEGTPWIYTWFVPQNVPGLVQTIGQDRFNQRLQEGFERQYVDLTNEPNLQAPWLFNDSGRPDLTQKYARSVFSRVFDTSPLNGWPGEEDEGQMGAYVILSALGLFDMQGGCAKEPTYQVSGPPFRKMVLHLDGGDFTISAPNNSPANVYIRDARLNGKRLSGFTLTHKDMTRGGRLDLQMSPVPKR